MSRVLKSTSACITIGHLIRCMEPFLGRCGVIMHLKRTLFLVILSLLLIAADIAVAEECNADSAWKRVRIAYPIHSQTLARCDNPSTGRTVIVLTEPPPHIDREKSEAIIKALFTYPESIEAVQRRRYSLGFDGWVEDLVIIVDVRKPTVLSGLDDNLALLATLAFGSTYKVEVENIEKLTSIRGLGPPPLEISQEELFTWLIGPNAQKLTLINGGAGLTLRERVDRNEVGTYYSEAPGLVIALLPCGANGRLNEHIKEVRRFVIDSDEFLGAIRLGNNRVALVGRERTTSLQDAPPLRLETIFLLASERSAQISQSYERRRAFAGKLFSDAGDLFGWDWAPILLSDTIVDTEFGSLLNFTDDMLKSWSESGKISYKGFNHARPDHFPFGDTGAYKTLGGDALTYNWNTAGVGIVSSMAEGIEIFTVRNTGSLPVSYFPEGSQENDSTKKSLIEAEDRAYRYFRTLREPLLGRAVQYAALYQAFLAFDVRASRPHGQASAVASINHIEQILQQNVLVALNQLVGNTTSTNREMLLEILYNKEGLAAQRLSSVALPPNAQKALDTMRFDSAAKVVAFDKEQGQDWRPVFARLLAQGHPIPSQFKAQLEEISDGGIQMVHAPEAVRREVVQSSDHTPDGWIRTPSIVISQGQGDMGQTVGGHNISGRATRIVLDATVPKGTVKASGTYEEGRILRLNPADKDAERDVVRAFDREVGLDDQNQSKGISAVEAKLREPPIAPHPIRPITDALDMPGTRVARGASPNVDANPVGYRTENADLSSHPDIAEMINTTGADVIVTPAPPGYIVIRPRPAPPKTLTAPNPTSMQEAVDLVVQQVSLGPPLIVNPKIAFHSMGRSDALRHLQSMLKRTQAGGKPPFGGDRGFFSLADAPEPDLPVTYSLAERNERSIPAPELTNTEKFWDSILSLAGKRRQRISSKSAAAATEYSAKPDWAKASLRFPRFEDTVVVGAPSNPGYLHTVEVTVPVTISTKPQSIFVRAMSWFKEPPSAAKTEAMESSITKIFNSPEQINVEEALVRYKTLMIDQHGAINVQINLSREGNDIIVVQLGVSDPAKRG
jgi:hypothetical protein